MQHVASEENRNKICVPVVWIGTGTSALRLYNNSKSSVTICAKIHSKSSSACTFLLNVYNYSLST